MPKKLWALAGALAGMGATVAVFMWRGAQVEPSRPLRGLQASEASRIEVSRQGESYSLENREGRWRLASPVSDDADEAASRELLAALEGLALGSEVSSGPAGYADYELTEASATRLRLYKKGAAAPVFDAYFGKTAVGYDSLYFRFTGEKPVLLATGLSQFLVKRAAADYRQRSLSAVDSEAAVEARLEAGGKRFELKKSTSGWSSSLGQEKTDSLVATLFNLRIADFVESKVPAERTGLKRPVLSVSVTSGVRESRFWVGRPKPEAKGGKPVFYYARAEGREGLFLVPSYDVDAILKTLPKATAKAAKRS